MATMVIYKVAEMPPEDVREYERWLQDNAPDTPVDEAEMVLDAYEQERDGVDEADEFDSDPWEVDNESSNVE